MQCGPWFPFESKVLMRSHWSSEMQPYYYAGNDLGRFVTTYNSEYTCQSTDGGDEIFCMLSLELRTKKKSIKNEIVGGRTSVKEGKSRRGDKGQGWKVMQGARERKPEGFYGAKKQTNKFGVSKENKGTQTQKLTENRNWDWPVEQIWKQRPKLENLSKVKNT